MLHADEVKTEYDAVRASFHKLIHIDPKASLSSLIAFATSTDTIRSKAISFLCSTKYVDGRAIMVGR